MAAATVSNKRDVSNWPLLIREFTLTSMTSDQNETVTHSGPLAHPDRVEMTLTERPTDGSVVAYSWDTDDDSVANGTITVRVWAEGGGSLDGAEARFLLTFRDHADQDGGSITVS